MTQVIRRKVKSTPLPKMQTPKIKDTSKQDRHEILSMACHILPYFLEINTKFEVVKEEDEGGGEYEERVVTNHKKAISDTIMFIDNFRFNLDSYIKRPKIENQSANKIVVK